MSDRKTALHRCHVEAGARMVPFAGWSMPVQYDGILAEHRHVREACGIFDLSHMGELFLRGETATADIQSLLTNEVASVETGRCVYSPMCNEAAGVVDDLVTYRLGPDEHMLVVNAGNQEKDLSWIQSHVQAGTEVDDQGAATSLIALQGPRAEAVLKRHCAAAIDLPFFHLKQTEIGGAKVIVSRTGYTGEDGFEVYCPNEAAPDLWNLFMAEAEVKPIGLGARDTLRLEARLLLYGNDLDEKTSPLEAGLAWTVKLDKGPFVGRKALLRQKEEGVQRKLVGFRLTGRGIARHGYEVLAGGEPVGVVTSGTFSPTLKESLGLGFVTPAHSKTGSEIAIRIRKQIVPAVVVKTPFYRRQKDA